MPFTPDPTLYPFASKTFDSSVGPVHYVDEGDGPTLLLLHGNPDWSFLYRHIIVGLRADYRCIAPDYPGFGLSPHPPDYGYTPAEHAVVVGELVEHLDLQEMVVMGQDWGGPIGMEVCSQRPQRIRGLVMGNTFFWPATEFFPKFFSGVMGSAVMRHFILEKSLFVTRVMRRLLQVELSEAEWAHYTEVATTPAAREGFAVFPREIVGSRVWLEALQERIQLLKDKPMVLMLGRQDPGLGDDKAAARWTAVWPDATVVVLPDAGHYLQEDDPDAVIAAIRAAF